MKNQFILDFVFFCLGFHVPLKNSFYTYADVTITCEKNDPNSVLVAIPQWGFISIPYLIGQMASVYMIVTLTLVAYC